MSFGGIMNFWMFYVGWTACVVGAGHGEFWLGPTVVAPLLLVHLSLSAERSREAALVLAAGLLGFAVDTVQAYVGLYAFAGTGAAAWLCPPWMMALWMVFAATLNGSLKWLLGRFGLAAVLGAICGPFSYLVGARLNAITLPTDPSLNLIGIAIVWAMALPALLLIRDKLFEPGVERQVLPAPVTVNG